MSDDIIDLPDVMNRVQDDKELLLELLDIYQEDFLIKRAELGVAVANKDLSKVKEVAHSMKGASGNISAKRLYENCLKLEQLAREQNVAGMEDVLKAIDGQFEEVKANAIKLKKEFAL